MSAITGAVATHFDEQALKRGAASVRHPLAKALLALTFTTGLIDAVSYLALGRVFTANMTGNIVLLGFGIAGSGGLPVVAPMGVRNAAVRHVGIPDLTTTVLTMTLTGLAADSRPAGGSGKGSVRRVAAVLSMLAGAVCGALLLKTQIFAPLALAAVLALVTWLVYVPVAVRLGSPGRSGR